MSQSHAAQEQEDDDTCLRCHKLLDECECDSDLYEKAMMAELGEPDTGSSFDIPFTDHAGGGDEE